MAHEMKYVIRTRRGFPDPLEVCLEPCRVNHDQMLRRKSDTLGAGFCKVVIKDGEVQVEAYGRSMLLDISSRGAEDAAIIKDFLSECIDVQ